MRPSYVARKREALARNAPGTHTRHDLGRNLSGMANRKSSNCAIIAVVLGVLRFLFREATHEAAPQCNTRLCARRRTCSSSNESPSSISAIRGGCLRRALLMIRCDVKNPEIMCADKTTECRNGLTYVLIILKHENVHQAQKCRLYLSGVIDICTRNAHHHHHHHHLSLPPANKTKFAWEQKHDLGKLRVHARLFPKSCGTTPK